MLKNILNRCGFSILDRYLIKECWLPFSAGCGIVTGVWLGVDQVADAIKMLSISNADIFTVLATILLTMPTILFTTIPIGTFLAAFLVFNRLSSDSELIAMRASGISLWRIVMPIVSFGTLMAVITFILGNFVLPWTQPTVIKIQAAVMNNVNFNRDMYDFVYFQRDSDSKHVGKGELKRIFYAAKVDPDKNKLNRVVIVDIKSQTDKQAVFFAKSAYWDSKRIGWVLEDCYTYIASARNPYEMTFNSHSKEVLIPAVDSTQNLTKYISNLRDLGIRDLWTAIQECYRSHTETESLNNLIVRLNEKFTYPFSCIALALMGAPLGIMARRSRTNWGYVQTGALIFCYFALRTVMLSFGETGKVEPNLATWIPNLVVLLIAVVAIHRRSRMI